MGIKPENLRFKQHENLVGIVEAAPKAFDGAGGRTFTYVMDQPVAPYLIALAVGDLRFQALANQIRRVDAVLAIDEAGATLLKGGKFPEVEASQ